MTLYVTDDGLKFRAYASLSAPVRGYLNTGDEVEPLVETSTNDGYDWQSIVAHGSYVGFAASKWLSTTKPTVTPSPPTSDPTSVTSVVGTHLLPGANVYYTKQLATQRKLIAVTCLEGYQATNLVGLVPIIILRPYFPDASVNQAGIVGDESDIIRGRNWYDAQMHPRFASYPNSMILQGPNEANVPNDGWFYLGLAQAADAHGKKIAAFNDSVASFKVQKIDGRSTFADRYATGCLKYLKDHGHYIGAHIYGSNRQDLIAPASGTTLDEWLKWGGKMQSAFDDIPFDGQADVMGTEGGLFETKKMPEAGPQFIVNDYRMLGTRSLNWKRADGTHPLKCVNYWTQGPWNVEPRSNMDPMMSDIARLL
jgi:hypothetical protein